MPLFKVIPFYTTKQVDANIQHQHLGYQRIVLSSFSNRIPTQNFDAYNLTQCLILNK